MAFSWSHRGLIKAQAILDVGKLSNYKRIIGILLSEDGDPGQQDPEARSGRLVTVKSSNIGSNWGCVFDASNTCAIGVLTIPQERQQLCPSHCSQGLPVQDRLASSSLRNHQLARILPVSTLSLLLLLLFLLRVHSVRLISKDQVRWSPDRVAMRLLRLSRDEEPQLVQFDHDDIPPYTILSHTWIAREEVTYRELQNVTDEVRAKSGFKKILACGEKTLALGYHYTWVDTCCIDQSSSAELSEAINSMFRWYADSEVCLVHLADFDGVDMSEVTGDNRWFTRGWTLQELVAPKHVTFHSATWHVLGDITQQSVIDKVVSITNINPFVLGGSRHEKMLEDVNVSKKMSWVAHRTTTRPEDIAYCLLGLFDVSMPPLHGEGRDKAFLRLQQEIVKNSDDTSIFQWQCDPSQKRRPWPGVLASGPECFPKEPRVGPVASFARSMAYPDTPYYMTNQGITWDALIFPFEAFDFDEDASLATIREQEGPFYSKYLFALPLLNADHIQRAPGWLWLSFILIRRVSKFAAVFIRAYPDMTFGVRRAFFLSGFARELITLHQDRSIRGDSICVPPLGFVITKALFDPKKQARKPLDWDITRSWTFDCAGKREHDRAMVMWEQDYEPSKQLTKKNFALFCLFHVEALQQKEPPVEASEGSETPPATMNHSFVLGLDPTDGPGWLTSWRVDSNLAETLAECKDAQELESKLPEKPLSRTTSIMHIHTFDLPRQDGGKMLEVRYRWRTYLYLGSPVINVHMSFAKEDD